MVDWTAPRTWVDGETLVASIFNTHLRDQMDTLHRRERVHCFNVTDAQTKDSEWEVLHFDSEDIDNNDMHKNRRHNTKINFNNDGLYLVIVKVQFDSNTVGQRKVMIRKNSDNSESGGNALGTWVKDATSSGQTTVAAQRLVKADRKDHINAFVWQSSTTALDVMGGRSTTFFQAIQVAG